MTEQNPSVLRRMVAPPREPSDQAVCRQEWAKLAGDRLGVVVDVTDMARRSDATKDITRDIGAQDLIFALTDQDAVQGIVWLGPDALGAMIEAQTLGRIASKDARRRYPTAIDAALAQGLVADWVAASVPGMAVTPVVLGARLADARAARFALPDRPLRTLCVTLDFADTCTGDVTIAVAAPPPPPEAQTKPDTQALFGDIEIPVTVVLARLTEAISTMEELREDSVLRLPRDAFSKVELLGPDDTAMGLGKLGRLGGRRAVRLHLPEEGATTKEPVPGAAPPQVADTAPVAAAIAQIAASPPQTVAGAPQAVPAPDGATPP